MLDSLHAQFVHPVYSPLYIEVTYRRVSVDFLVGEAALASERVSEQLGFDTAVPVPLALITFQGWDAAEPLFVELQLLFLCSPRL